MITPLRVEHWESVLALHPDKPYVDYIVHGIRYGFRVGFVKTRSISSAQRNTHSANENPSVVSKYLAEEQEGGWFLARSKMRRSLISTSIVLGLYPNLVNLANGD